MEEYFLTYGRGMKQFVLLELKTRIESSNKKPSDHSHFKLQMLEDGFEGKLFFTTNLPVEVLSSLKTVERLFTLILFEKLADKPSFDEPAILESIERQFNFAPESPLFAKIINNWTSDNKVIVKLEDTENASKKPRILLTFRVDCRLTGKWRRLDRVKHTLVESISSKISKLSLLEKKDADDYTSPSLIITCHLTELCFVIGIALCKDSLSVRSYIENVGLRSTVCAAMIQTSNLDCSDSDQYSIVLDPFCGKSTIQNEYLEYIKNEHDMKPLFFMCADRNREQIDNSRENLAKYETTPPAHDVLVSGLSDSSIFPFRDGCADLIITDLPFGKNHQIEQFGSDHRLFYRKVLAEFVRLLAKPRGVCVLLVNSNETDLFDQELESLDSSTNGTCLRLITKQAISLGETSAHIYKMTNF